MGMTPSVAITDPDRPRAWIGSLAAYHGSHDGVPRLIGEWYDASDAGEVTVADLHRGTGAPYDDDDELWVMDLDGDWPVRREMDPTEAAKWGEIYTEVGDSQWPALCAWVRSGSYISEGDSDFPSLSDFEEAYAGNWETFRDYAFQLVEGLCLFDGLDREHIVVRYFDWDSWIRDLEMDYSVERDGDGGVYVFRSL